MLLDTQSVTQPELCRMKGRLRLKKTNYFNGTMVGDVGFEPTTR